MGRTDVQARLQDRTVIHEAVEDDIVHLSAIHREALPDDFLAKLGLFFLTRVLYPMLLDSPRACIYVVVEQDIPRAFIITRTGMGGLIGDLLRKRPILFPLALALGLVRRPRLLAECWSIVRQLWSRALSRNEDEEISAELFLLAVAADSRQKGLGRALVEHSAKALHDTGIQTYRVLLHADNQPADRLYQSTGFDEARDHHFGGRHWRERWRQFSDSLYN